jgi:hypothetical protein
MAISASEAGTRLVSLIKQVNDGQNPPPAHPCQRRSPVAQHCRRRDDRAEPHELIDPHHHVG